MKPKVLVTEPIHQVGWNLLTSWMGSCMGSGLDIFINARKQIINV